jgi:prepilin-type N-terminal cleavage/methylation domain-containing protein
MPTRLSVRAAGFTLIELLVTMIVVAVVLGAALALFNSMNEISRVQIHQADMQQAVRVTQREITRLVQMTGRGGLGGGNLVGRASDTAAIEVRNNVGLGLFPEREIVIGGGVGTPTAVEGTDVLTVRGVFNSSVLQLAFTDPAVFTFDGVSAGTLVVASRTPTGIPQNLEALEEAFDENVPEALVLVNAVNELTYAVVELDPATSDFAGFPDPYDVNAVFSITIGFKTTGGHTADYATLSPGGVLPDLASPAFRPGFLGILEEYRYYVREDTDADGEPIHKLSRAQVFPRTQVAYRNLDTFLEEDIADYIFDLQVALGFDSSFSADGETNGFFAFDNEVPPATGNDDVIYDNEDDADDWLFNTENAEGDETTLDSLPWRPNPGVPPTWTPEKPQPLLYYARVTTLGRAARRDRGFAAPVLDRLEDHVYEPDNYLNTLNGRAHRREILQSVIDLRNIG